jgi:hypothetical protein
MPTLNPKEDECKPLPGGGGGFGGGGGGEANLRTLRDGARDVHVRKRGDDGGE